VSASFQKTLSGGGFAMSIEDDILAAIDLIYEAAFDSNLWPTVLIRLADTIGTAQIGILSLDRRARTYDSIAPRCDPVMDAKFKNYWAFHNPLWPHTIGWPVHRIFQTDDLISRRNFIKTSFFNEWMRPAEFGVAAMGANLLVGNEISTIFTVGNAPGKDEISEKQSRIFKAVLPHIDRAIRIHRRLQLRDLDHDTTPDRLERMHRGVMLVDGAARVLFANAAARTLLHAGRGLALKEGCVENTGGSHVLQRLIASCIQNTRAQSGPGGKMSIPRGTNRPPLRVTVAPLRLRGSVKKLPWLGLDIPAAVVTIVDPDEEKGMH
jgi:hypothetical protein